jgi:hypothetical protein
MLLGKLKLLADFMLEAGNTITDGKQLQYGT